MDIFRKLAANEMVQSMARNAASTVMERMTGASTDNTPTTDIHHAIHCKMISLTSSKVKEMEKMDRLNGFSCFFDRKAELYHVILISDSPISVWNGQEAIYAKRLASALDPLADLTEERNHSVRVDRVKTLLSALSHPRSSEWSSIHIAAASGFTLALKRLCAKDAQVATNHATQSGILPLHLAVETRQKESVRFLIGAGASLAKGDSNGRTALHYAAAQEDSHIMELLLSQSVDSVDCVDGDGESALFVALRNGRPACVRRLLSSGASPVPPGGQPLPFALVGAEYSKELEGCLSMVVFKFPTLFELRNDAGSTVFHIRLDKHVLSLLLCVCPSQCSLSDVRGRPPLIAAASRSDVDSVCLFLAHDSPVDAVDAEGNTALHHAVLVGDRTILGMAIVDKEQSSEQLNGYVTKTGDASTAKALLLFGADPAAKNKAGMDAAALCKNVNIAHALRLLKGELPSGLAETEMPDLEVFQFERALMAQSDKEGKPPINVLSLDGGGIRGLVLIELLSCLESSLGGPIMDKMEWIGGTSTGAILALGLAQGRTVQDCRKLYFRFKDRVFYGKRPYDDRILEEFLQKEFGLTSTLSHITDKKVVVTTCIGTLCPPELKLLRTYQPDLPSMELHRLGYSDPHTTTIWHAARCSSAAPTYFSAVEGKWMDGGLVANNPIGELLQDISTDNDASEMRGSGSRRIGCVLSLGTGCRKAVTVETLNLRLPSGIASLLSSIETLTHLKNVLVEQKGAFFRFTPVLDNEIMLDETDNAIIIEMLWNTRIYMRTQSQYIKRLVKFLRPN